MRIDAARVRELARRDFEGAWLEGGRVLREGGAEGGAGLAALGLGGRGREHPVQAGIQRVRELFLGMGFDEVVNPVIVDESDVYAQYGPEAPVILDRCFYLAGLPRPDIGLGDAAVARLRELVPGFSDVAGLQSILRDYKKGAIEGDDFVEAMVSRLGMRAEDATRVLDTLFPSFRELAPVPSRQTLRSHMTTPWFVTLAALAPKRPLPLKLFSTGLRFRREQREDATHLRAHFGASCVVASEGVGMRDGELLARQVLRALGFERLRFEVKKATSKYYAPGMEVEVYAQGPQAGWVEVADLGMYSPVALAHYGIEAPVLNIGFGIERVVMLGTGATDVRAVMYPQLHEELSLTDAELAAMVRPAESPSTEEGREMARALSEAARSHADDLGPCRVVAWRGSLGGVGAEAALVEEEAGKRLLGPAALNRIVAAGGSLRALSPGERPEGAVESGVEVIDALSALAAARAERELGASGEVAVRARVAKQPSDINVSVEERARKFIRSHNRRIDVRGPVFVAIVVRRIGEALR